MGTTYSDIKNFKKNFKSALRKVRTVAPTIQIEEENGGIRIIPDSLPAINEIVNKPVSSWSYARWNAPP